MRIGLICLMLTTSWLWAGDGEDAALKLAIKKQHDAYMEALFASDPIALAKLYTEDAVLLRPGAPSVNGRTGIEIEQRNTMERAKVTSGAINTIKLEHQGNLAYEIGEFSYTFKLDGGPAQTVGGKFLTIWRLQPDGVWLREVEAGLPQ